MVATKLALKYLARRVLDLNDEIAELDRFIVPLVEELAPNLLELEGVGIANAGELMVAAGENPDRLRSEASFAMMCGACPIPVSSGKTQRHRLIQVLLARRWFEMSADRASRVWRQAQLQVPRRRLRRRIASGRPRPTPPSAAHHVWAYDFVYDRCASGQPLKCLTVVDEWTRECLAIEVSGSIRSRHVIDVLSRLISIHGAPSDLRSDNGPEFVSRAILKWLAGANIDTAHIDPGKPWQNATNESFNDKFRDECLSLEWFRSREEARVLTESWRRHDNEVRPHSSLGYLTPRQFINQSIDASNGAVLQ